jgi:4a-hydroxytetrahydrobiopterin dehydratase
MRPVRDRSHEPRLIDERPRITTNLSPELMQEFERLAETEGKSKAELARRAIGALLEEDDATGHSQAPDWQLLEEAHRIERSFRFRDFREALTFVQEIGELAEAERHHPNINFGWGNATVSLQTKKIKGLHENDFIMATKIDRIFAR